jgi:hypothetical protein
MLTAITPKEAEEKLGVSETMLWHLVVVERKIRRVIVQRVPHYKWALSRLDVERLARKKAA